MTRKRKKRTNDEDPLVSSESKLSVKSLVGSSLKVTTEATKTKGERKVSLVGRTEGKATEMSKDETDLNICPREFPIMKTADRLNSSSPGAEEERETKRKAKSEVCFQVEFNSVY